jgi:hypothetical protein
MFTPVQRPKMDYTAQKNYAASTLAKTFSNINVIYYNRFQATQATEESANNKIGKYHDNRF